MKNSTAQLEAWLAKQADHNPKVKRNLWAQFLAVADEIQAGVNAGYSLKLIHEYLTDVKKLECNYDTFLRYQKRYQKQQKPIRPEDTSPAPNKEQAPATTQKENNAPKLQTSKPKTFNFTSIPDTKKIYGE